MNEKLHTSAESRRSDEQDTLFAELDALMGLLKARPEARNTEPYAEAAPAAEPKIPILDEVVFQGEKAIKSEPARISAAELEALVERLLDEKLSQLHTSLKASLLQELRQHLQD